MGQVFHLNDVWIERGIGASVLLFLTGEFIFKYCNLFLEGGHLTLFY